MISLVKLINLDKMKSNCYISGKIQVGNMNIDILNKQ